jgi:hypothetical protein
MNEENKLSEIVNIIPAIVEKAEEPCKQKEITIPEEKLLKLLQINKTLQEENSLIKSDAFAIINTLFGFMKKTGLSQAIGKDGKIKIMKTLSIVKKTLDNQDEFKAEVNALITILKKYKIDSTGKIYLSNGE